MVLRASPPPHTARPDPHGLPVGGHAPPPLGFLVLLNVSLCRHAIAITPVGPQLQSLHVELPQRPSPSHCRVGSHIVRFEACSAFTRVTACLLAELPKATLSIEGFGSFVTSTVAPIATGRSDSLPGENCTH